jgi:hypothetical protein
MLYRVSHSRHAVLIAKASDIDIHGSAGLVRLWVVDQEGLELVGQADDPIGPVVERGSLQAVCDNLDVAAGRTVRSNRRVPGGPRIWACDWHCGGSSVS